MLPDRETSTPASAFKGAGSASAPASTAMPGETGNHRARREDGQAAVPVPLSALEGRARLVSHAGRPLVGHTGNVARRDLQATRDSREYTPAEAIDLLNSVLSTKNFRAHPPRPDVAARAGRRGDFHHVGADRDGGCPGQQRRVRVRERTVPSA